MDWFEYVIVGSGPSGVAAARRLAGQAVCIVDVANLPDTLFPYQTLDAALNSGDLEALLGKNWEMLSNLVDPKKFHPKLRAPEMQYVMSGIPFQVHDLSGKKIISGAGSYAAGGMSNVWGAQLLRYTQDDLDVAGGWPYRIDCLQQYYEDLEKHIGIAGEVDDMFGGVW